MLCMPWRESGGPGQIPPEPIGIWNNIRWAWLLSAVPGAFHVVPPLLRGLDHAERPGVRARLSDLVAYRGQPPPEQFADRRGAAWHSLREAEILHCPQLIAVQHDLKPLASGKVVTFARHLRHE